MKHKVLLVILLIAACLRFVGTKPGYNQFHADEGITYSAAIEMVKNGNLDPLRYDYPALVPLLNYVFFKTIFVPLGWGKYYLTHLPQILDGTVHLPIAKLEAQRIFQVFILGEREINTLFWGRYVTALFSLGNVFLTYLLGKRLFNKKVGLIAAFLIAFNYKQVVNSHIGLPDVYNAFFLIASILAAINIWKNPSRKNYLIGGILAGLSFSVKYQIFSFLPLALSHLYVSYEKGKLNFKKLFRRDIFMAFLFIPLIFLILNPYHFIYFEKVMDILKYVSLKYGMGAKQLNIYPLSYLYHIDYGPAEFVLVFLGMLCCLKKYFNKTLLLFSALLPFFFLFLYYSSGGFYVRNFITITPIVLVFAAVAIWLFVNLIKNKFGFKFEIATYCLLLPLVVYIPAKNSVINSYFYTKSWGYDIMRPWVKDNLPKDVVVAAHPFDASNLGITNIRTDFEQDTAYSLNEHKENGAQYAVIDLNWAGETFYSWMFYGLKDLAAYWNKPLDIIRNTYHGLAMEELFRYQIYAVTKPWQAPDTHLIVVKFYDWPDKTMKEIKRFGFEKDLEGWSVRGKSGVAGGRHVFYVFDGSALFLPGATKFPTVRLTSQPISVKEGHLYKVSSYLKTGLRLKSKERDGFIRVDFFAGEPDFEKVGIISSVSSRVYGTDAWVKKEVVERAPKESRYLTISFQAYNTTKTKIWLDDVVVEESIDEVEDITAKTPYNIQPIDLNYVYPNSHGNL